jgi:hypothetical protein
MAVTVVGSTVKVKSWVGRTTKCPVEVVVPPEVVTEMGPVVAPVGTTAVIVVGFGTVKEEAGAPLKVTDCTLTKFVPVSVIVVPTLPDVGVKLVRVGAAGMTVRMLVAEVKPGAEAVRFTVPGATPATGTGTATVPAGIKTLGGTVAMLGLALSRVTRTPPAGAGDGSWAVRVPVVPATRVKVPGVRVRGRFAPWTVKVLVKGTRGLPLVSLMSEVSWTV